MVAWAVLTCNSLCSPGWLPTALLLLQANSEKWSYRHDYHAQQCLTLLSQICHLLLFLTADCVPGKGTSHKDTHYLPLLHPGRKHQINTSP